MQSELRQVFSGKRILITGNTGFKGSWLTLWLLELDADILGYSLEPPAEPNLFRILGLEKEISQVFGDIRDFGLLAETMNHYQPEILFHLAAQPIVLKSYENPLETFHVNAMGTVNVLEAARKQESLKSVVLIATDKCYDNKEWIWGYRENDALGGSDPYSASKAMAEIAASSYRNAFFGDGIPLATARAGNVIGGGDFSDFRLLPDCMKALMAEMPIHVRNPESARPWMHVLDALHGYLNLAKQLIHKGQESAQAWNFGPKEHEAITALKMVEKAIAFWGEGKWVHEGLLSQNKEMRTLKLNWEKAASQLRWHPRYSWEQSLKATVDWFKAFNQRGQNMKDVSLAQIRSFMEEENQ